MATGAELRNNIPQEGELVWIGVSSGRRSSIQELQEVEIQEGTGLVGDHHATRGGGKRQVTLIQAEHLPVIAALAGLSEVSPETLRRNLVVSGLNLSATRGRILAIGDARLRVTGPCAPCSRMEHALGPGGYNAMRGHGGWCAEILASGDIETGAPVTVLADP